MTRELFAKAISRFLLGVVLVGLLIFLPAGTLQFAKGWLLMGVLFVPMFGAGMVLMVKNPELLRKRLQAKESRAEQSLVIKLSGLMFAAGFVLAGLDYRFQWMPLPGWVSCAAAIIFVAGYGIYAEVLRENAYLSRTIEVQQGQKIIDTGLYGMVRHPMYSATLLLFLSMPLVLGSVIALPVFAAYPAILVKRITDEERLLTVQLPGYEAYLQKVRWRLIPFVW